jgi:hypothetical protein
MRVREMCLCVCINSEEEEEDFYFFAAVVEYYSPSRHRPLLSRYCADSHFIFYFYFLFCYVMAASCVR